MADAVMQTRLIYIYIERERSADSLNLKKEEDYYISAVEKTVHVLQ